jgi:hypothetical protein
MKASVVISEYLNTSELVNQTRHWNQMPHTQDFFMQESAPQAGFFVKRMRRRQNWCRKMCRRQYFFDWILILCHNDVVCESLFTNHWSESSFFH